MAPTSRHRRHNRQLMRHLSAELPMLFGSHYGFRGNPKPFQWEVANSMQALWLSFARDSSKQPQTALPDGSICTWAKYSMNVAATVEFASDHETIVKMKSSPLIDDACS